jgi:hypothetical protein
MTWNGDEIKKPPFVQNAQNIGFLDTVFEELVSNKSFTETFNFLRLRVVRLDHQNKEKLQAARQTHNASQSSHSGKKDKVTKVLVLINAIQIQNSCGSDKESYIVPPTKPAMVCKLVQITPEICINLPLEAKT